MPGGHEDPRDEIIRRNGWALAWLASVFGVTIIGCHIESGRARWSAAAWEWALEVPGSPATWGAVILVAGLFLLAGCHHDRNKPPLDEPHPFIRIGHQIAFAWFALLDGVAILAFVTDFMDDDPLNIVNPLAMITWSYMAWMYGSRYRLARKTGQVARRRQLDTDSNLPAPGEAE